VFGKLVKCEVGAANTLNNIVKAKIKKTIKNNALKAIAFKLVILKLFYLIVHS